MGKRGVSLALSSGGARGLAHIGVLKVLDKYGVPITGIAGSSMGGLVGALYATGYGGSMIEEVASGIRRSHWIDLSLSRMGLVRGKKLEGLVNLLTRGRTFADCKPPLKLVAVDIERGEEVVFDSGPVADAVRATCSIPGIFSPMLYQGKVLVDGGVLNRVPVDLARQMSDGVVVAVDVGVDLAHKVSSVFDVLFQTFDVMAQELRRYKPLLADVIIEPRLGFSRDAHMSNMKEFVRAGEEAAEQAMPEIWERLNRNRGGAV